MGHRERQRTTDDGLHHFCAYTQGHSNKPVTVYSTKDSRLAGMKVTVSFYLLSDKERTLLAADFLLISLHLAIFWHRAGARDMSPRENKAKQKQNFPTAPRLSSGFNDYILCRVAESSNHWLTISEHFCHLLSPSLTLLLSLLQLLSNDIWPREATQQPGKLKPLKDSS